MLDNALLGSNVVASPQNRSAICDASLCSNRPSISTRSWYSRRGTFARSMALPPNQPRVVICHTVKGKGIPAAENNASWHHKAELSDDVRPAIGLDSED